MTEQRTCRFCGAPFQASRSWQKYDRDECRRRAHEASYRRGETAAKLLERIGEILVTWKTSQVEEQNRAGEHTNG